MSEIKGDFIGFTFNGVHSSELGLVRVSDGSRYSENLLPTIEDKTVQVPGADGTYFFGSYYTQQPFNISVAFDDMSEEQFQKLKRLLGDKRIHDFIFDESPYKVYRVKSTGTPNLKYVCFNKGVDEFDREYNKNTKIHSKEELYSVGAKPLFGRVYKGEGQLNFICYSPYARSRYKYLDEYDIYNIPEWGSLDTAAAEDVNYNLYDWLDSIKLKRSDAKKEYYGNLKTLDEVTSSGVMVYNPGNFPVHFSLYFIFNEDGSSWDFESGCSLSSNVNKDFDGYIRLNGISQKGQDEGFRINGKLNLIEGVVHEDTYVKIPNPAGKNPHDLGWYYDNSGTMAEANETSTVSGRVYYKKKVIYNPTGNLYNDAIEGGNFFRIPITEDLIWLPISPTVGNSVSSFQKGLIEYDYLYY